MSENEITQTSLDSIKAVMKDGEEPTEVLFSLVSSPLITLKNREIAQVYTAKDDQGRPVVLAIFAGATWDELDGLLPAELPTLGPGVLAVPKEQEEE